MASSPISSQILCPEYEAKEGSKRCRHFAENRSCALLAHPVCEEWLRRNAGKPIPNESSAIFVAQNEAYRCAVVEGLYFRPGWKAKMLDTLTAFPVRATPSPTLSSPALPPVSTKPPQATETPVAACEVTGLPNEIEVASFKALGVEVCIVSETLGELWLVSNYTANETRKEITLEHLLTLCRLIAAFPGCRVSQFIKTFVEA